MAFSSRHGIVGLINPTMRPGPTEELIRLLPEGIGVIPLFLNIREGTTAEFKRVVASYEPQVALLAEQKCDLIHLIGAPPFMVLGRKAETKLIAAWQKKYRTPIFTVPQNHVAALKALKAESIVGATYFPDKLNAVFAGYLRDAGIDVLAMDGVDVPFDKVQELPEPDDLRPHQAQLPEAQEAPRRSTCWAPAGARSTSSTSWNASSACRWCIR